MPGSEQPVGVVLAGGDSARMGREKARIVLGGQTLGERAAGLLALVAAEVVVADRGRRSVSGFESVADAAASGPVAGILGAAEARPRCALLVLACDLPLVSEGLLRELCRPAADWVVPRWRRGLEPLVALYRPPALAALARLAATGRWAPRWLAAEPGLSAHYLEGAALERWGPPERTFWNLNRPEDLAGPGASSLQGRATGE